LTDHLDLAMRFGCSAASLFATSSTGSLILFHSEAVLQTVKQASDRAKPLRSNEVAAVERIAAPGELA
jgi:hypothetical protein